MTLIVSMFGFAARMAGDLLTTALGWASSLLFGRVPRSHQIYLVLMMAWSFLWIIFVVALVLPSIAALLLSSTPHPPFVDQAWLGFALLLGVVFLPLGVGLAGALVPGDGSRPGVAGTVREAFRGYLLAPLLSGLLLFLAAVGVMRKIRSRRHGWADTHVPIVVDPGGYDRLVDDLHRALLEADLPMTIEDAPRILTVPAWLLTHVAGGNVRKLRPDRLVELCGPDLRIGVFPSDVAISGTLHARTRARAAILSRIGTTSAHLTTSAEAQEVEDRLGRIARGTEAVGSPTSPDYRQALRTMDAVLLDLPVGTDEWDVLYRLRLQVERDLLVDALDGSSSPTRHTA